MDAAERSLASIELDDLVRLAQLAAREEVALFNRRPAGAGRYRALLLCRALCQGAALHFIDRRTGVKDFDVWSFYAAHQAGPFPYRWRGTVDFGPSRFGRYPRDPVSFAGRRVDLLGRSIDLPLTVDAAIAVRTYLTSSTTKSAKLLAAKAGVLLHPADRLGEIVWPVDPTSR
ncbi:hypothetical protein [Nonomuraea solani]|uniref:hypothetical protein n=1 Tax=Nonomuraea solani TaxID=1144553 RepID=UPI0011B0CF3B|nr:hypothetical protein [Nonomuraea solani]